MTDSRLDATNKLTAISGECATKDDSALATSNGQFSAPLPPPQARTHDEFSPAEVAAYQEIAELERKNFAGKNLPPRAVMRIVRKAIQAESAPQEAPLEIINRWISQVENPDFGSVPSKKTLLELLGYVREEIAASKTAAPQEAGTLKLWLMMKVYPDADPVEYSVEVPIGGIVKVCDGVHVSLRAERGVPDQKLTHFECLQCGFTGPLTVEEIEAHRVTKKCSGTTVGIKAEKVERGVPLEETKKS